MHFIFEILGFLFILFGGGYLQICRWERMDKDSEEWRIVCAFYDVDF